MNDIMKLVVVIVLLASATWSAAAFDEHEQIEIVNQSIIDVGACWVAGETTVSGLTPDEKAGLTLPMVVPAPTGELMVMPPLRHLGVDERFDWRDTGGVTPVKNQGRCGSCWAFAAIGAIESAFLVYAELETNLSEQHLISECCRAGNCDGGWPDWSLDYVRDVGIPTETCYPYVAQNTECAPCDGWKDQVFRITDHVYVEPSTATFKYALKKYGPMAVVLTVPSDWYYYRSGVYEPVQTVGYANHAVVLVGWDDSDGCWFIKNSWGAGWGEQGYARVKYGNLERYNYAYAITGVVDIGDMPQSPGWIHPVCVAASSEHSEKYCAEKAIDNDTTTHWFSDPGEISPSITFDLGETVTINKTRVILHYYDVPSTVDIAGSIDRATWWPLTDAVDIIHGAAYVEIPTTQAKCRYVRVTQTNTKRGYGTCTEFEVWQTVPTPEPHSSMIELVYRDRTETIVVEDDVIRISMVHDGNRVFELWNWWQQ